MCNIINYIKYIYNMSRPDGFHRKFQHDMFKQKEITTFFFFCLFTIIIPRIGDNSYRIFGRLSSI